MFEHEPESGLNKIKTVSQCLQLKSYANKPTYIGFYFCSVSNSIENALEKCIIAKENHLKKKD